MKISLSFILILLYFTVSFGQVATIKDPDGWTNVRKEPNSTSEIIHKLYENKVFWYNDETDEEAQSWIPIYIPKNDFCLDNSEISYIRGYIHKSRLLPLDKLNKPNDNRISFNYKLSDFDSTNRVTNLQDGKWITEINGRPIWGTDGDLPKTQVDNIELKVDGKNVIIHKVFYSDIYECDNNLSIYINGDVFFVHQWNSDGAGSYEIVWVINKYGLIQRLVGTII